MLFLDSKAASPSTRVHLEKAYTQYTEVERCEGMCVLCLCVVDNTCNRYNKIHCTHVTCGAHPPKVKLPHHSELQSAVRLHLRLHTTKCNVPVSHVPHLSHLHVQYRHQDNDLELSFHEVILQRPTLGVAGNV